MGGTRIFVWKMKDLIKIGIIAAVGLTAVVMLVLALTSNGNAVGMGGERGAFIPGTYTAQIILHNKPVNINVTVTENEIVAIEMTDMLPAQELMYPLFRPTIESLSREILRRQSTNVAIDGTAVVTSMILLDAVNAALLMARDFGSAED